MSNKKHVAVNAARPPAKTPETSPASFIEAIERAALNPDVDIDKMERLLQMSERMVAKQAEAAFNSAMSAAQAEMGRIAADAENRQTSSRYASYAALDRVVRPIYTKHGFALTFDTGETSEDSVQILCRVVHSAGHSQAYQINMPCDGKGAKGSAVMTKTHAMGSATQYGMRYLLKLIFNLAIGNDDDGNAAAAEIEYITDEQVLDLEAMIDEVGADRGKFMAWLSSALKADALEEISTAAYKDVVRMLEIKRKQPGDK